MPGKPAIKQPAPIAELIRVMAKLRSPKGGCPWDLEQNHKTLRRYTIEEAYELIDAIETGDDREMAEELGDLLLQVVFHCQMARERGAFDFDDVCALIVEKLIRRHPHVFGTKQLRDAAGVLAQWDQIKRDEKKGTRHERTSVLDGVPRHLPALMRAEKLVKKAVKAGLSATPKTSSRRTKREIANLLLALAAEAQARGWSAEELLRSELKHRVRDWQRQERRREANPSARKSNHKKRAA